MSNIIYSGVVIDEYCVNSLIERFKDKIPKNWHTTANFMLITHGELPRKDKPYKGHELELEGFALAKNKNVMAIRVNGFKSDNKIRHIIIATKNKKVDMDLGKELEEKKYKYVEPILLNGFIREITKKDIKEDFRGIENHVKYKRSGNEGSGVITTKNPDSKARDAAHGLKYQTSNPSSESQSGPINETDDEGERVLCFYDLDRTLIYSPTPETGKGIWANVKGKEYPHLGWWGQAESLDPEVFKIKPIQNTVSQFKKDYDSENTVVVLLTNRKKELKKVVMSVIEKINLNFDHFDFYENNRKTKGDRILSYLKKYPETTRINVYEDEVKNLTDIKQKTKNIKDVIVNIYKVTGESLSLY